MSPTAEHVDGNLLEALRRVAGQAAAGNAGVEPESVGEYDFNSPRRYTRDAARRLQASLQQAARAVGEGLAELVDEHPHLMPQLTQHYRVTARERAESVSDYALALRAGGQDVGALVISRDAAVRWTEKLLGGTGEDAEADRVLSGVELAILYDVAQAILSAFCRGLGLEAGSLDGDEDIVPGGLELPGDDAVEYSWISLDTEDHPALLAVVLFSELLDAPAGKEQHATESTRSSEQERQHLLEHLQGVPIRADACIGEAELPMGELASLQPGDVVLLDRCMGQAIEMSVQGRRVLRGLPVECEGRYAVQVECLLEPDSGG